VSSVTASRSRMSRASHRDVGKFYTGTDLSATDQGAFGSPQDHDSPKQTFDTEAPTSAPSAAPATAAPVPVSASAPSVAAAPVTRFSRVAEAQAAAPTSPNKTGEETRRYRGMDLQMRKSMKTVWTRTSKSAQLSDGTDGDAQSVLFGLFFHATAGLEEICTPGNLLFASSANATGHPPAERFPDIMKQFELVESKHHLHLFAVNGDHLRTRDVVHASTSMIRIAPDGEGKVTREGIHHRPENAQTRCVLSAAEETKWWARYSSDTEVGSLQPGLQSSVAQFVTILKRGLKVARVTGQPCCTPRMRWRKRDESTQPLILWVNDEMTTLACGPHYGEEDGVVPITSVRCLWPDTIRQPTVLSVQFSSGLVTMQMPSAARFEQMLAMLRFHVAHAHEMSSRESAI